MGKNKSKKNRETKVQKDKSLLSGVKSLTKNKKVLYSLLGAAGAGIAIAALGKDRRRSLTDTVTNSVKGLGSSFGSGSTDTNSGNSTNQG